MGARFFISCTLICLAVLSGFSPVPPTEEPVSTAKVVVITVDGSINPASAEYINSGIKYACENSAECLIVRLNTPGGLLKSTRVIVSDILDSDVPVVVFVHPGGAQAASAGVFVTLAAHIAVMAPGTNIGAAHPVDLQGQADSVMNEKATNDAAAFIRAISEKRLRNIRWAEDAVRKSLSITENEALKENVIDLVAESVNDLLEKIDGREVALASGKKILNTRNAEVVNLGMTFAQKILGLLSDPNIAYILLMIGIYGIFFEFYNPGSIFPGVIGFICLILALYSLHTLPVNYAGLALILFAIILFIIEIKVVSYGLLTVGGIISLILGSIMLINVKSGLEVIRISWQVILVITGLTVAFFLVAIGFGIKAQTRKPVTGIEGMTGETGEAISDLEPEGQVRVHGEIWNAECPDGKVSKGSKVIITGVKNLKLIVRKST
ncbi:MAG TPA: nodulation protein NfeD [Bacteroidales bacterium]|nr:nodulation protein NfeD [Bacteroidales bacterium]HOM41218.1 nodulation protein NfeD [Bacteroidales bacterium]HRT48799.1 nodulation protein NfeD [Bacteroidales bacterium]HRU57880.1 nodulation protein NfeD [Bacteroidales bacterium]